MFRGRRSGDRTLAPPQLQSVRHTSAARAVSYPLMRRRLFTLAAVLSAVLCVGTCALWVRSYSVQDTLLWQRVDGGRWASSVSGHLILAADLADWSGEHADFYGVQYRSAPPDRVG